MSINGTAEKKPLRIAVGSDEAGVNYKDAIKADFESSDAVAHVVDVGVMSNDDKNRLPQHLRRRLQTHPIR